MTKPTNAIVRSIDSAEKPLPEAIHKAGLRIVRMDTVKPEPIEWLWFPYLPSGKVSIWSGPPGLGKSMSTISFAAHVTNGWDWIDGTPCPEGSVVLVSCEDDPGDTIRPRLDAAGARAERVHYVRAVGEVNGERSFTLADVPYMEELLQELGDCRLIIIDPVSAFMSGIDTHNNSDVRQLLAPLATMAAKYRVAVVAVTHLNKGNQGSDAIGRVMGSLALVAAARAAYVVTKCKEDDGRRLVLPLKNNLGPDSGGLSYRIASGPDAPYVTWDLEKVTGISADEAMRPPTPVETTRTAVDDAEDFLHEMLRDGSRPTKDLQSEARAAGVSWGSCERARARMAVTVSRHTEGNGGKGYWAWALKVENDTPPTPIAGLAGLAGDTGKMRPVEALVTPANEGLTSNLAGDTDEEVIDI